MAYATVENETLLRPRTIKTMQAIAEAIFASEAGPPPEDRIRWVCSEMDDVLAHAGTSARTLMRAATFAVAAAVPIFARRPIALEQLSLPARIEALEKMERSFAAAPLLAVKALLCILYYEHPDAAREIGYDGGCGEVKP
ncbi:MAG: hypothetical protein ACYC8T_05630 [Myxococcaceae bacterium]